MKSDATGMERARACVCGKGSRQDEGVSGRTSRKGEEKVRGGQGKQKWEGSKRDNNKCKREDRGGDGREKKRVKRGMRS